MKLMWITGPLCILLKCNLSQTIQSSCSIMCSHNVRFKVFRSKINIKLLIATRWSEPKSLTNYFKTIFFKKIFKTEFQRQNQHLLNSFKKHQKSYFSKFCQTINTSKRLISTLKWNPKKSRGHLQQCD